MVQFLNHRMKSSMELLSFNDVSHGQVPAMIAAIFYGDRKHENLNLESATEKEESIKLLRVKTLSYAHEGISPGDILMVDKSRDIITNTMVVAVIDGEFTIKRLSKVGDEIYVMPETASVKPARITLSTKMEVWGVVTGIIKKV